MRTPPGEDPGLELRSVGFRREVGSVFVDSVRRGAGRVAGRGSTKVATETTRKREPTTAATTSMPCRDPRGLLEDGELYTTYNQHCGDCIINSHTAKAEHVPARTRSSTAVPVTSCAPASATTPKPPSPTPGGAPSRVDIAYAGWDDHSHPETECSRTLLAGGVGPEKKTYTDGGEWVGRASAACRLPAGAGHGGPAIVDAQHPRRARQVATRMCWCCPDPGVLTEWVPGAQLSRHTP